MQLFSKCKDGGPKSHVTGYFLIEWKRFFSVVLLRFDEGSREAYHSHAFNSISWVLSGALFEKHYLLCIADEHHQPSLKPVVTLRSTFHKVLGCGPRTWVLSFRGPWHKSWIELDSERGVVSTLTDGRVVLP